MIKALNRIGFSLAGLLGCFFVPTLVAALDASRGRGSLADRMRKEWAIWWSVNDDFCA